MPEFTKVTTTAELPPGKMKEYRVSGKVVVVVNSDGDYFAFDGICTHEHCALAGGFLDGYTLTCYCHGGQFDISTGEVLAPPPPTPLNVYKVKVEGEDIFVELKARIPKFEARNNFKFRKLEFSKLFDIISDFLPDGRQAIFEFRIYMIHASKIKLDFPIFNRQINGKPIVYLDSTASSLKPQQVLDAISDYYTQYPVNIFRGLYTLSEEATAKYEEVREKVAIFIGADNGNTVVFVRNATEAINLVVYSWGRVNIGEGDEIISTVMEHHANIVPWQSLALETGATLKYADLDEEGYLDTKGLESLVTPNTKLVALTHVSNVLGTINPVKEIIKRIKKRNSRTKILIDGAQSVPHMNVNVKDLGCDFFAFSGHKMLGPTGVGVLWAKYNLLDDMVPFQMGGEMIKEVYLEKTEFKKPPHKFEAGTPDISGVLGLGAAIDYLSSLDMEKVRYHEKELTSYALSHLRNLKNIKIYGPTDPEKRGGVIAFTMKGLHPHDIAEILNEDNICIRSGHHCAMPLHTRLGISASSRASFYVYNTEEDVEKLVKGLERANKIFKLL